MPSGLRVSRIDRAPATGELWICVNGMAIGGLHHRTMVEITMAPGHILFEVMGSAPRPLHQVLEVPQDYTARVQIGRRLSLGIVEATHYIQVDPPLLGLPDRTLYPLNLAAYSALEWLQQKRALGEELTAAQMTYLQSQMPAAPPATHTGDSSVPSLAELGAFAALGLNTNAQEADVREAFRLLVSIHTPEAGQQNETILRLEEAFQIAMNAVAQRVRPGVSEVGR
ncbi:MAG: hypothetical protein VKM17_04015 [Cyanobacteriota bacterium]|nr:hypothetical protein [Cyanobacteriota bacterium]